MNFPSYFPCESRVTDRSVDPVVESVAKIGGARVSIVDPPAGEENFFEICFVVSVSIFQEKEVGRLSYNDASIVANQ